MGGDILQKSLFENYTGESATERRFTAGATAGSLIGGLGKEEEERWFKVRRLGHPVLISKRSGRSRRVSVLGETTKKKCLDECGWLLTCVKLPY